MKRKQEAASGLEPSAEEQRRCGCPRRQGRGREWQREGDGEEELQRLKPVLLLGRQTVIGLFMK